MTQNVIVLSYSFLLYLQYCGKVCGASYQKPKKPSKQRTFRPETSRLQNRVLLPKKVRKSLILLGFSDFFFFLVLSRPLRFLPVFSPKKPFFAWICVKICVRISGKNNTQKRPPIRNIRSGRSVRCRTR